MAATQRLRSLVGWRVGRLPGLDLVGAILLSGYVVLLTCGLDNSRPAAGPLASLFALSLTAPVAWRRAAPLGAACTIAVGSVVNAVLIGHLVRCGPALPAVFAVAYAVGLEARDATRTQNRRVALGLACCGVNIAVQSVTDPQLGIGVSWYMCVIALLFFGLGRISRSWGRASAALRRTTAEIEDQRALTLRVAIEADRAILSVELESLLCGRIDAIALQARTGREALRDESGDPSVRLLAIEHDGRAVLREMRTLVLSLDEGPPSDPAPTLAELPALLRSLAGAGGSIQIRGEQRPLPAVIELSGYRIVEHLVSAIDDEQTARVGVRLDYRPDELRIEVRGAASTGARDLRRAVAAARARAALHGGGVEPESRVGATGRSQVGWQARLPLVSSHV